MVSTTHFKRLWPRVRFTLAMLCGGLPTVATAAEAQIAVAANFTAPMRALVQQFSAQYPTRYGLSQAQRASCTVKFFMAHPSTPFYPPIKPQQRA